MSAVTESRRVAGNARGGLAAIDLATARFAGTSRPRNRACGANDLDCAHTQAQAVTVMPGVVFQRIDRRAFARVFHDRRLSAYGFSIPCATSRTAKGRLLDHGGPTIVGGIVYVNSGHADGKGGPGNVLLAFSVEHK